MIASVIHVYDSRYGMRVVAFRTASQLVGFLDNVSCKVDNDKCHWMSEFKDDGYQTGSNDICVGLAAAILNFRLPVPFFSVYIIFFE